MMTPADLYRDCRVSAWRVEARQHYTVPGDEDRQRAFHSGQPLPPPGPGKKDDLKLIAKLRRNGVNVGRIHLVTRPLSGYVRYELAAYVENAAAGEEIRIADLSRHPGLAMVTEDFTVFDSGTPAAAVVTFDYDADGLVHGYEISTDPVIVRRYGEMVDLVYARSVPLGEFVGPGSDCRPAP